MINKNQLSTEDYEICSKLKSMRFSGMAEALEEVFADPNAELLPFREKIQRMLSFFKAFILKRHNSSKR